MRWVLKHTSTTRIVASKEMLSPMICCTAAITLSVLGSLSHTFCFLPMKREASEIKLLFSLAFDSLLSGYIPCSSLPDI